MHDDRPENSNVRTFDGALLPGLSIASGDNPWIEIDDVPITWPRVDLPVAQDNDCYQCAGEPLAGVLTGMDFAAGIQRCDTCARFAGDLDAALALTVIVGGVVKFEQDPAVPIPPH